MVSACHAMAAGDRVVAVRVQAVIAAARAYPTPPPTPPFTLSLPAPHLYPLHRARALEAAAAQHNRLGGLQHPGRSNSGAHHPALPGLTACCAAQLATSWCLYLSSWRLLLLK